MKLATVQFPMHTTVDGNVAEIEDALVRLGEQLDVQAVLFPECALTGFHRGLPALCRGQVLLDARTKLQAVVDRTGVTALFGTPHLVGKGVRNTLAVLTPDAPPRFLPKIGLTESESRFFSPGHHRLVFDLHGLRATAVLCREVLDAPQLDCDLILWPSYIQWDGGPDDYIEGAKRLAQASGAHVVQSNWPSSLNEPHTRGMGGSVHLGPDGALKARMARDKPDTLVIDLPV
ncbi:MAG: carbon-nitrogen hydrolase family protein [Proteobacteria bacterium]|nr:carbon-nitrogen hydrolase family protein [Pseudomonadota bacterium]MCP4918195.1 carbon-nitrogen hydrolase family protein [Pseudomonadota bacterium]